MTTTDAIDPARAEFMRRLSELEDLHFDAGLKYGFGPPVGEAGANVEEIRIARRAVVEAYDQASLLAVHVSRPDVGTPLSALADVADMPPDSSAGGHADVRQAVD